MIGLTASLLMLVAQSSPGSADRVVGLLTVPQVFGMGPCVPFEPKVVPLFAEPRETASVASIEVDTYWTFPPNGGCEGLEVRTHDQGRQPEALPTEEL